MMREKDEVLELSHTLPIINKIKIKHPEVEEKLKAKGKTTTRLLTGNIISGNKITLMANLQREKKKMTIYIFCCNIKANIQYKRR